MYTGFAPAEKDGPATGSEEVIEVATSVDGKLPDTSPKDAPLHLWRTDTTTQQGNVNESSDSTALSGPLRVDGKKGTSKLPYSLASYILFGPPAPVLCKQHQAGTRRSSKRKFDTACECGPSGNKRDFASAFTAKYCGVVAARIDLLQNMQLTEPTPETMSLEPVFLGYARVWAFADRFAIASLMDLASSQLAYALAHWTISPSAFVPEFGELVRYVYGDRTAGGRQLRRLVAEFAACLVEDVGSLEGWHLLLKDAPAFAADLILHMVNRFC